MDVIEDALDAGTCGYGGPCSDGGVGDVDQEKVRRRHRWPHLQIPTEVNSALSLQLNCIST